MTVMRGVSIRVAKQDAVNEYREGLLAQMEVLRDEAFRNLWATPMADRETRAHSGARVGMAFSHVLTILRETP